MQITVNGQTHQVDVEPDMPLLWVLRDELGFTGVKYGCGVSQCGACTVHVNGTAIRSCQMPVGDLDGPVTTIDGLGTPDALHAVQAAWMLAENPNPSDAEIDEAMNGNLCRCGTYERIRAAVKTAAKTMQGA